jgi:DNA polymerase-3 subunit delta
MSNAKERSFIGAIGTRPEIRLFFIFGQDESAAADIASQMSAALTGSERIDIDSDRIRNDPALLADEASALSLFGDKRHIRLNFRREEGVAAVENLLALEGDANPVIATAGNLTKASKLRKLVEAHPRAMVHICYDAAAAVMAYAATMGLKIDRPLAARIARYTGQDRKLAQAEIEKLSLYYDSSPQRPATVEVPIFEALSAETGEENINGLIHQVMGGDLRGTGRELVAARDMGVDAIRIIRAMQRRVTLFDILERRRQLRTTTCALAIGAACRIKQPSA